MTETILLAHVLTTPQTWGLIAFVFFALAGVWSLLEMALDALNDWLNEREYDAQYKANEEYRANRERRSKAWTEFGEALSADQTYKARQSKAWTDAQEKFKAGRRVQ